MRPIQSSITKRATDLGLPIFQPERIRDAEAQARIRNLAPDVMVVVAYGQILPVDLINAPRLGTVNVHASLLPRHRGPAPIEWAILSGDQETGVTIMQMDAGVDTGPILSQERLSIRGDETAAGLERRLATAGAELLVRTMDELQAGKLPAMPQAAEGVTHAPRLHARDGKLDPTTMTAVEIDRRVRALAERIGTWMPVKGVDLKVFGGYVASGPDDGLAVPTVDGIYVLQEVQPAGGRRMTADAWMRGRR